MAIYTGAKCLICSEKFKDDDDIVVCPECGTPYHRSCYKEKKCINTELHNSGGSWMLNTIEEAEKVPDMKICPHCQALNKGDAENCLICGNPMQARTLPQMPEKKPDEKTEEKTENNADLGEYKAKPENDNLKITEELFEKIGQDPDEVLDEESGITCGEIADYVKNLWFRYLIKFKKLKLSFVNVTTNFTAFFFPEYFFAARKMYPHAVIVLLLNYLISLPAELISYSQLNKMFSFWPLYPMFPTASIFGPELQISTNILKLGFALNICVRVVCCLKADEMYFNDIIRKLKKMKLQYTDSSEYKAKLKETGGVSIGAAIILFLSKMMLFLLLCIIFAVITIV